MNNGIRVDLDKLLEGKKEKAVKDKDGKKYSIDDIRQFDAEETLMERIRNRGSMTMQEYLMWSDYRVFLWFLLCLLFRFHLLCRL